VEEDTEGYKGNFTEKPQAYDKLLIAMSGPGGSMS
jgi:hypothetical protein